MLSFAIFHLQYYHTKSAELRILFSPFCGNEEGTIQDEGKIGLASLNDLYLYRGKSNRNKNTTKEGKLKRTSSFLVYLFLFSNHLLKWDVYLFQLPKDEE